MLFLFLFICKPWQKDESSADGLVHGVGALYNQLQGQRVDPEGKDSHERAAVKKK